MNSNNGREIFIEFIPMGTSVKVCAIDSLTGTEVSIVGPANAGQETLKQNAIKKLQYILSKK